jgi:acyl-CoA reductase-like NAD-dependent aldehyde dehydrogenase
MPTVLAGVRHDMAVMREETFGPVACIMRVRDEQEAVELANDTPFGLGAAVFSGSEERARRLARRLTAGMIGINRGCGGAPGTPWVGARQSGYGHHSGPSGHRQFAQPRVVSEPVEG